MDFEAKIREAARASFDADARVKALRETNTSNLSHEEARKLAEDLAFASAQAERLDADLVKAKHAQ